MQYRNVIQIIHHFCGLNSDTMNCTDTEVTQLKLKYLEERNDGKLITFRDQNHYRHEMLGSVYELTKVDFKKNII